MEVKCPPIMRRFDDHSYPRATTTTSNHSRSPSEDGSSCHDEEPDDNGSVDEDEHDEFDGESSNPTLQRDGEVFSLGSSQHPGSCIPCAFYCFKRRGCDKDKDCQFCHMAHYSRQRLRRDEWKRRQHEKRRRSRALANTYTRPATQLFGSGGTIARAAESAAVVSSLLAADLPLRSPLAAESLEACSVSYPPPLRAVPSTSLWRDRRDPSDRCVATITQARSDLPPLSNGGSVVDRHAGSVAGGGNRGVAGGLGFLPPTLSAPCAVLDGNRSRRPAGSNSIGSLASGSATRNLRCLAPSPTEGIVGAAGNAAYNNGGASSTQVCEPTFRPPCLSTGSAGGAIFCGSPPGFLVEVMNARSDEPCFLSVAGPDVPQATAPSVAAASSAETHPHLTESNQIVPQCLEQLQDRLAPPGQPLRQSDLLREDAELQSMLWRI